MRTKLKKLCLISLLSVVWAGAVACGGDGENQAPEIVGAHAIDCIVGEKVDLLYRVAALDPEDGDVTRDMVIDVTPSAEVVNGIVVFEEAGTYDVMYRAEDSAGEATIVYSSVTVYERDIYRAFLDGNGFAPQTEGSARVRSAGVTDGRYKVRVVNAQKPSDARLSRTFELTEGAEYSFEYTVKASAMGSLRIAADGTELAQKQIEENADATFTFDYKVPETEESEEQSEDDGEDDAPALRDVTVDILFGSFGTDIEFEIERVKITPKAASGEYEEQLEGFTFDGKFEGRFDGTEGSVGKTENGIFVEIARAADADWRGGMFVNTGVSLEAGDRCRLAITAESENNAPFEVVVQNRQWDERKYGTLSYSGDERGERFIEFTVSDDNIGSLWLYVQSGRSVNKINVSGLSFQKRGNGEQTFAFDRFTESHSDGGTAQVKVENGKITYTAQSFGAVDYNNKLESPTFSVDGTVDKFIVSFKAKATKRVKTVFVAPRSGGWDPNLLWTSFYIETTEQYYFFTTNAVTGAGLHNLIWQFGAAENQKYKDVVIEISDIRISFRHGLLDYKNE